MNDDEKKVTEKPETDKSADAPKEAAPRLSVKMRALLMCLVAIILILAVALVIALTSKGGDNKNSGNSGSSDDSGSSVSQGDSSSEDSSDVSDDSSAADDKNDSSSDDGSSEDDSSAIDELPDGISVTYNADNAWADGDAQMCGLQLSISNKSGSAIKGWTLVLEIDDLKSCDGWNGSYSVSGNTLTITNAEYNGEIADGSGTTIGCNIGTGSKLNIKSATLNDIPCTVVAGKIPEFQQQGGQQGGQQQGGQQNGQQEEVDVEALLERAEDAEQGDDWLFTDGSKIVDKDGKEVWITGVNWFGYNTGTNTFDGLWNSQLEPSVKAIADHGFNLIRVPMSAELLNQWAAGEYPQANYNNAYNTALNSMNSLEIFDYFLKLAEANGLKVMPDIHSAETDASGHNINLWYTANFTADEYYSALEWFADRYKDNDTIIAFDLKNEPHGKPYEGDAAAIWNDSDKENNWKHVAEVAASKILAKNPNLLIMVEGTEIYPKDIDSNGDFSSTDDDDYFFNWWGGNLRGVKDFPVDLGKYQNKLVYSPHDYGPTVYQQPWFQGDYDYDSLMADCWQDNWLYIQKEGIAPLLIGEWGGFMKEPNLTWMTYMRQLISEYHLNHTFWCFNANSGDTGGLVLDDFVTWDEEKYAFVKEVLWQQDGKFVGLDHKIALGENGINLSEAEGLS